MCAHISGSGSAVPKDLSKPAEVHFAVGLTGVFAWHDERNRLLKKNAERKTMNASAASECSRGLNRLGGWTACRRDRDRSNAGDKVPILMQEMKMQVPEHCFKDCEGGVTEGQFS